MAGVSRRSTSSFPTLNRSAASFAGIGQNPAAMARLLLALLLGAAGFAAAAEDALIKPGDEKLTLRLGAFLPAFKTRIRVDNDALGPGDPVDLGDDLGVDQNESGGWFGAEWRFAPRHRIGFSYSRFTLSGSRTLQRNIQIDDEIFPAGAQTSTQLRLEIIPLTYSYSVLKREHDELAATIGLHWSRLSFSMQGSASLGTQDLSRDASAEANVPLPLLGLRYDHHFSDRWSAGAGVGVFALEFAEDTFSFQGSLWSVRVHAEYRFARNFGIGVALDGFQVDVDMSKNDWRGGFEYGYWGPQIYLTARF